jgi:hypothetical protein
MYASGAGRSHNAGRGEVSPDLNSIPAGLVWVSDKATRGSVLCWWGRGTVPLDGS